MHQFPQRLENLPLSLQRSGVMEVSGNDVQAKVALAIGGTGMTAVSVTFVDQFQLLRFERFFQAIANQAQPILGHGKTCLNG